MKNAQVISVKKWLAQHPIEKARNEALYAEHERICKKHGAPMEEFERFASDIVNAPAAAQAGLLNPERGEAYAPFMQYTQYTSPRSNQE